MPVKTFKLSDGTKIPWIGFGTGTEFYQKECAEGCKLALSVGYTHIDTAEMYQNEAGVGVAIKEMGNVSRENLYVTTKLWEVSPEQSVEDRLRQSLQAMNLEYVDLYLVHNPSNLANRDGGLKQVWKEMVEVKRKGLTRSIGVSNFSKAQLLEIMSLELDVPVLNQVCATTVFYINSMLNFNT